MTQDRSARAALTPAARWRGIEDDLGPRIEWEVVGPGLIGAALRPFFVCAVCGERITGGLANALFELDGVGGYTGRWVVVHRGGPCDSPGGPFRSWSWGELSMDLVRLLHNSGYNLGELSREISLMVESESRLAEAERQQEGEPA
jgi:hypothetical protein